MSEETTTAETTEGAEVTKRAKKCVKAIEGTVVKIQVLGQDEIVVDFASLPEGIQEKLGPFGLGHKLGDAAAGREGTEAVEAINKVVAGLRAGDWSVRAPAQPKITMNELRENLAKMSEAEQEIARKLLASMNLPI